METIGGGPCHDLFLRVFLAGAFTPGFRVLRVLVDGFCGDIGSSDDDSAEAALDSLVDRRGLSSDIDISS